MSNETYTHTSISCYVYSYYGIVPCLLDLILLEIFSGNLQNQLQKMSSFDETTIVRIIDEAPPEIISRSSKSSGMCHFF